jgi:hypothetical protein
MVKWFTKAFTLLFLPKQEESVLIQMSVYPSTSFGIRQSRVRPMKILNMEQEDSPHILMYEK